MANKTYQKKYVWSSMEFDKWTKEQQQKMRKAGFNMSQADVTHKLYIEVILPNNINIQTPVIKKRRLKYTKRQIY